MKKALGDKIYLLVRDVFEYLNASNEIVHKWIIENFISTHIMGKRSIFDCEKIDQLVKSDSRVEADDGR